MRASRVPAVSSRLRAISSDSATTVVEGSGDDEDDLAGLVDNKVGAAAMVDLDLDKNIDPFSLELSSPVVQSYFEVGNLGPSFQHEDRIPVFVLTNLLGGGMSSLPCNP